MGPCYNESFFSKIVTHIYTFFICLYKDIFISPTVCTEAKLNYCGRWVGRVIEEEVGKSSQVVNLKQW